MRDDTTSHTEADAAEWAQWLGRSEDFGGGVGDQEANALLDERFRCEVCEYGHQGYVCRWCIAAGRTP